MFFINDNLNLNWAMRKKSCINLGTQKLILWTKFIFVDIIQFCEDKIHFCKDKNEFCWTKFTFVMTKFIFVTFVCKLLADWLKRFRLTYS